MSSAARVFAFAATVLGLAACGGGGNAPLSDDGFVTCATETRAEPYQPGRLFPSVASQFAVKLMDSQPGPPIRGFNTWTVEVMDAGGTAPAPAVVLGATGFMPDHGHGTDAIVVTALGDSVFKLDPVRLRMSGYWEVTLDLAAASGDVAAPAAADKAVLTVCVP